MSLVVIASPAKRRLRNVHSKSHLVSLDEKAPGKRRAALNGLIYNLSLEGLWTGNSISWEQFKPRSSTDYKELPVDTSKCKNAIESFPYLVNLKRKEWVDVKAQIHTGRSMYHPLPFLVYSHNEADISNPALKGPFTDFLYNGEAYLINQTGRWNNYDLIAFTQAEFTQFMNEERNEAYKNITKQVIFSRFND